MFLSVSRCHPEAKRTGRVDGRRETEQMKSKRSRGEDRVKVKLCRGGEDQAERRGR